MRQFFDFEADEKKPADEHKIVLQSEGFWCKHTLLLQSNLYKATTLGITQKWPSWTGGCLIKHLYKTTTN